MVSFGAHLLAAIERAKLSEEVGFKSSTTVRQDMFWAHIDLEQVFPHCLHCGRCSLILGGKLVSCHLLLLGHTGNIT